MKHAFFVKICTALLLMCRGIMCGSSEEIAISKFHKRAADKFVNGKKNGPLWEKVKKYPEQTLRDALRTLNQAVILGVVYRQIGLSPDQLNRFLSAIKKAADYGYYHSVVRKKSCDDYSFEAGEVPEEDRPAISNIIDLLGNDIPAPKGARWPCDVFWYQGDVITKFICGAALYSQGIECKDYEKIASLFLEAVRYGYNLDT